MNQAIRGVERSVCFRWASRRSFSFYGPALGLEASSASAASDNNLTSNQQISSFSLAESNNDRRYYVLSSTSSTSAPSVGFRSYNSNDSPRGLHRYFSSVSAAPDTTATVTTITQDARSLSALQQANLELLTPGQAIYTLQRHAAKGTGNLIRQSDFIELCNSARPGKLRDALVIATALKEFKRNNRFVLQVSGAKAAVEGMLRSRKSTWKVHDGKPRVKAAVFVAEQILNEDTGLYFAIETTMVDKVMEEMHKGLIEMKENGFKVSIDSKSGVPDEGEDTPSPTPDETLIMDALRVTQSLVHLLIRRKSRPEWDIKNKRAARRYLKRLQIGGGPYRSTLQVATKISLLIGGSSVAQGQIIDPFERAWWTKFVDEESLKLIQKARDLEAQQAILTSATLEEDVGDNESEAEEGDESNEDDEELADGEDSVTDVDAENEDENK